MEGKRIWKDHRGAACNVKLLCGHSRPPPSVAITAEFMFCVKLTLRDPPPRRARYVQLGIRHCLSFVHVCVFSRPYLLPRSEQRVSLQLGSAHPSYLPCGVGLPLPSCCSQPQSLISSRVTRLSHSGRFRFESGWPLGGRGGELPEPLPRYYGETSHIWGHYMYNPNLN